MDLSRKLTPHFTLGEMVRTSHRSIDNTPTPEIVDRLTVLCRNFLEPIRDAFGPLWVTSGFRCEALNRAIGGSSTSSHVLGCAADIVPVKGHLTVDIVGWMAYGSDLRYDQVIDEYSSTANWIHVGMARPGREPRLQALTMRNGKYSPFMFGPEG